MSCTANLLIMFVLMKFEIAVGLFDFKVSDKNVDLVGEPVYAYAVV